VSSNPALGNVTLPIPVGQGTLNPGLHGVAGAATAVGDLHGYPQEGLTGNNFTFANTERVPLDTSAPDANHAMVMVGSDEPGSEFPKKTFTSRKLSGPGFFLGVPEPSLSRFDPT
jgi:hypothetical protein